jgi:glycosyltransferase involved in cell wall biosynthesis
MVISYFIPEIGSAAHVYHDLARAFISNNHEVTVITSYPRKYNLSTEDADKIFSNEEILDGIHVYRVENQVNRDNIISRGLEHFTLSSKFLKVFKRTKMDFDICLIYIPPLPLYKFAVKIKKIAGIPSILNFQDFHPQELTDVGVLKNPVIVSILKRMEREAYSSADQICVLTKGGVKYITDKGGHPNRISHIYNGTLVKSDAFNSNFKTQMNIENKFLITYAGILSQFQGLDSILDAAKILNDDDIIIYIVGDGVIKDHLESRINEERIINVVILPLQSREKYLNIINSSDITIISLDRRMKAPCFPGKTMNLMLAGKPIIAIVPESETSSVIREANCGIVIDPDNLKGITEAINLIKNDQEMSNAMGMNGRIFAASNFNIDLVVQKYEDLMNRMVQLEKGVNKSNKRYFSRRD